MSTKNSQTTTTRQDDSKTLNDYIISKLGCKWKALGRGPDTFDCWGFVLSAWRHIGWADSPDFPYSPDFSARRKALVETVREKNVYGSEWSEISSPIDKCLCVMFKYGHAYHVGIYADGNIFHCVEKSGVVGTSIHRTKMLGYEDIKYFTNEKMPWL